MQSKKIRINGKSNIVKLAAYLCFGAYLSILFQIEAVASLLFACSIFCVIANYGFFIAATQRVRIEDIALVFLTIISVVLSDWVLDFDFYKPAIIVFCTILCIELCIETEIDFAVARTVTILVICTAIITIVEYYFLGLKENYFGSTNAIALNFSNPNITAMWLLFFIILLWDAIPVQANIVVKLFILGCIIALFPILFKTESRNCLIAVTFYIIGKLILPFLKLKKMPNWCVLLITIAPVIVYFIYMYVFIPYYDGFSEWFLFLESEGKPLTSRFYIWSDLKMDRLEYILFGNYGVYHQEQLHNAIVTLYCRFGIFYVILVIRKFYRVLQNISNAGIQLALGTVWLIGCFETAIFTGSACLYMLVFLLPVYHKLQGKMAGNDTIQW